MAVGIDLLEIERMEKALARRPRLAQRLFTDAEQAYARGKARPGQHLAARFCAKEAVAKALHLEVWNPLDVEVVPGPGVRLSGHAAAKAQELGVSVEISLTHSREMAGAVALSSSREARCGGERSETE